MVLHVRHSQAYKHLPTPPELAGGGEEPLGVSWQDDIPVARVTPHVSAGVLPADKAQRTDGAVEERVGVSPLVEHILLVREHLVPAETEQARSTDKDRS